MPVTFECDTGHTKKNLPQKMKDLFLIAFQGLRGGNGVKKFSFAQSQVAGFQPYIHFRIEF